MDMPKLGPDQERLHVMAGEWRGTETMHPTPWLPQGGMRDAHITNRIGLDGFAIIQDYVQSDNGAPTFNGHAVILKKPQAPGYLMYWFDSFSPSVFEGAFDGVHGEFVSDSPMGKTRATWDFSVPRAYSFAMALSQDGVNWQPMMDGQYTKT